MSLLAFENNSAKNIFCHAAPCVPVLEKVGGVVEQSMIRSDCVSSEMALHRDAAVVSCWDRPCKLAALMNLVQNTTHI